MSSAVRIPAPLEVLYGQGTVLSCDKDGQLMSDKLHGLFAGDTRVLSTYRIAIGGFAWKMLGHSRSDYGTAEWHFQNPAIRDPRDIIPEGAILLTLRRRISGALHDDLRMQAFSRRPVHARFTIHLDSDFADIFEVKEQSLPPRLNLLRKTETNGLTLSYKRGGFQRGLRVRFHTNFDQAQFVGTQVIFELDLKPGEEWRCCLEAEPVIDGEHFRFIGDPHSPEPPQPAPDSDLSMRTVPVLQFPFNRGRADLRSLAIPQPGKPPYLTAGVPWFFTLFGRDQLFSALMAGLDGSWSSEGALSSLAPWQAKERDDWRDAEPGKLPHELRRGELAFTKTIPHTPYYGTHDAPALYCLALWNAWKWSGKRELLNEYLETARKALAWCEQYGDRDNDGLQEYGTRSRRGYYNQSWKDAGDAILHEDGRIAETPLATVELQGYLFAAYRAVAEIMDELGDAREGERLRDSARRLKDLVEEKFWTGESLFYATALDKNKEQVRSISSNPGHLLWCGLPDKDRARGVAGRLLEPDMFSGWGLRSLSAAHPAYNPLSYQLGSVWPFDTALAAAGLWRYGILNAGEKLLQAVLEAAGAFEESRLPELFCGMDRSSGGPVPYEKANSPQAWSAAVPLLAVQLFLGIIPDAPHRRCFLSPHLPEWLPFLEVKRLAIGEGKLDVRITRKGTETAIDELNAEGVEVVRETHAAPLWGKMPGS